MQLMDKTPCQLMAEQALDLHVAHYHYDASFKSDIKYLKNYKGVEGFFMKKFLINDKFNLNKWRVTWDAIKKDVWGFIGKPLVLTPKLDHPAVSEQEDYRVGNIIDVGLDEVNHSAWQVSDVFDEEAQRLIENEEVEFGSPTVLIYSQDTREVKFEGTDLEEHTLHRFKPAHDAIVSDPAYHKGVNKITGVCKGDPKGCALKLLTVSASVEYRKRYEKADVNEDNTQQLTIVPFVRSAIKKRFSSQQLSEIVGHIKQAEQGADESCISRKIKIISNEHPDWEHDKVIAVAYSYCGETGNFEDKIAISIADDLLKYYKCSAALIASVDEEAFIAEAMIEYLAAADEKGHWRTVKGHAVFFPDGEDPKKVLKEHFDKIKNEKKSEPEKKTEEKAPKEKTEEKKEEKPKDPDYEVVEHPSIPQEGIVWVNEPIEVSKTPTERHKIRAEKVMKNLKANPKDYERVLKENPKFTDEFAIEQSRKADEIRSSHEKLVGSLMKNLKDNFPDGVVTGRVKDNSSMVEKLARKPKYKDVSELEDTSGARVVSSKDNDDVMAIVNDVKKKFNVVSEDNYIDESKAGYHGYHVIIQDPDTKVKSELQIRTKNQDKWAIFAHESYKPTSVKQKEVLEQHGKELQAYLDAYSEYYYKLDSGQSKDVKKPECPPVIAEKVGCIEE